jgi:hypothetical protein
VDFFQTMTNATTIALAFLALLMPPLAAAAEELETTHLFGFTLGTDVNNVGEKEAELENNGRFGKRDGTYAALSSEFGVKFIPWHNFSIEPEARVAYHDVAGVSGLDDRRQGALEALTFEMRYRLLEREHAPFGLTVGFDPHWGRVDEVSGEPVDEYGGQFLVAADRELIERRLFAAVNLTYEPDAQRSRITGLWQHQSSFGASAAVSLQLRPGFLMGAEVRYLSAYGGLGLDSFAGRAVFAGPTLYWKISELYWMSAAWSVQIAGHATSDAGALDLTNFERQQAILRFGYNF